MLLLMFHGDHDFQVDVEECKDMSAALRKAGKDHDFVPLKGVTHQLECSADRMTLPTSIGEFLRKHVSVAN